MDNFKKLFLIFCITLSFFMFNKIYAAENIMVNDTYNKSYTSESPDTVTFSVKERGLYVIQLTTDDKGWFGSKKSVNYVLTNETNGGVVPLANVTNDKGQVENYYYSERERTISVFLYPGKDYKIKVNGNYDTNNFSVQRIENVKPENCMITQIHSDDTSNPTFWGSKYDLEVIPEDESVKNENENKKKEETEKEAQNNKIGETSSHTDKQIQYNFSVKEDGAYEITISDKNVKYKIIDLETNKSVPLANLKDEFGEMKQPDNRNGTVTVSLKAGKSYKVFTENNSTQKDITVDIKKLDAEYKESNAPSSMFTNGELESVAPIETDESGDKKIDPLNEKPKVNFLERVLSEFFITVGDFFVSILNKLFEKDITIAALVFNQVDEVNPNFFDESIEAKGFSGKIKDSVTKWFSIFMAIAIAIYIIALLGIAINILLYSTTSRMATAKQLLLTWIKSLVYLVFIPYIIKYAFLINEAMIETLASGGNDPRGYELGTTFGDSEEWSTKEIEFRSPKYVSRYTGKVKYGSKQASKEYMNKLVSYEQNLDLMRIMRAYAGVTQKLVYVFIWWVLIFQLVAFIVQYYKRFFMIAFLIGTFPIVCIFNGFSMARGKPGKEIETWLKEVLANIFMQSIQAIIYTIVAAICIATVKNDLESTATLNWILIILAINFVSEGEKLLKKIMGAMGSTTETSGQMGSQIKKSYNQVKSEAGKVIGGK